MNISSAIRTTLSNSKRALVAGMAVTAVALVAPFAMGGGNAQALAGRQTFSNQVMVTALCSQGGVTLLGMGNGDIISGNIEVIYPQAGFDAAVWLPGVGTTWTAGPKTPFRYTANATAPFMSCVEGQNMRALVTYTVSRAPFWQSVLAVNTGSYALAQ